MATQWVKQGRTELYVPSEQGNDTFVHPAVGPNTYAEVGKGISQQRLRRPTFSQTSALVHRAFQRLQEEPKDVYALEIKDKMNNNWFWGFTRLLWTPEGVYGYDNLKDVVRSERYLKARLGKKEVNDVVYSDDGNVRFASRNSKFFRLGEQKPSDLENNAVVRVMGKESSGRQLAFVAAQYRPNPFVFGVEIGEGQKPEQGVSALDGYWCVDGRLDVSGDAGGDSRDGYAFGVDAPQKILNLSFQV
jgi:hypothetical protein